MDAVLLARLQEVRRALGLAEAALSDPEVIGDRTRYAEAGRRYADLKPVAQAFEAYGIQIRFEDDGLRRLTKCLWLPRI